MNFSDRSSPAFTQDQLQPLIEAVQRNCNVSDARHAGDYTLCVYLLKMREYFRWEKGYAFSQTLPEGDLGDWLRERESFWQSIEDESFGPLPVDGSRLDPFDDMAVNAALNPLGLVYSGGLGIQRRPHFFLGRLQRQEKHEEFTILISEAEFARDLTAPPAMTRGSTIFVRRESLRRMIWEKIEEWRWNRLENAMARAIRCFDIDGDAGAALDDMTDTMIDSVLLHEKGEASAAARLGPEWEQMLGSMPRSKTEIMIRALRDHLADSLTTLPALVDRGNDASLHFFFANLTNMRKDLFPALTRAYETWVSQGNRGALRELLPGSEAHWNALANQVLDIYRERPDDCAEPIRILIENNRLGIAAIPV